MFLQVSTLRSGYRSVPLKNAFNEDLELASLLVHVNIRNQLVSAVDGHFVHRYKTIILEYGFQAGCP